LIDIDHEGLDRHVVVIGAGIAGLAAAYELERLGCTVEILEASGRIGGRIYTHRFGPEAEAPFADLGAMRIPRSHRHTMRYVHCLGLGEDLRPFHSLLAEPNAFVGTAKGYLRLHEAARSHVEVLRQLPAHRERRAEVLLFGSWLTIIVDAIAPPTLRRSLRQQLDGNLLDVVGEVDLVPFVDHRRARLDLHGLFSAHPLLRNACSGSLRSFLDDILAETSTDLVRLRGGMDRLVRRLARRLRSPIRCRQAVVGLDVTPAEVTLRVRENGRITTRRCPFAVCTVPFSILHRMETTGLSADKLDIVRSTRYVPATKVAFHCQEAFWEKDGIHGGASSSGGRVRQTYYPPVDGDPALGAVLLASYSIGADADLLGRLPAAARYAAVLADLGTMHPQLLEPGMVRNAISVAWGQQAWGGGGCSVRWGKSAEAAEWDRLRATRPEHGLFFAGEHCSAAPAWIDGAIESATAAAAQIAERLCLTVPLPEDRTATEAAR